LLTLLGEPQFLDGSVLGNSAIGIASNKNPALFLLNKVDDLISEANDETFSRNSFGVCHCVNALRAAFISASEGSWIVDVIKNVFQPEYVLNLPCRTPRKNPRDTLASISVSKNSFATINALSAARRSPPHIAIASSAAASSLSASTCGFGALLSDTKGSRLD
jgi:hypothetical protein